MNHDETNSKSEPQPGTPALIDPALEARVVAWVAGEASAFEVAELERLSAAQPELEIFRRRIEAVHGLVGEAARPDREPLRMSAERRAKVLQAIGAGASDALVVSEKIATMPQAKKPSRRSWRGPQMYFVLAGAAAAGVVAMFVLPTREVDFGMASTVATARSARETDRAVLAWSTPSAAKSEQKAASSSGESLEQRLAKNKAEASANQVYDVALAAQAPKQDAPGLAPSRPAPAATINGGAEGRAMGVRGEIAQATAIVVPAAPPTESVVVLDAFTVSAPRDTGYAAAGIGGSASGSATKSVMAPAQTFGDDLKANLASNGVVGGATAGRLADNAGIVLGAGAIASDDRAKIAIAGGVTLSSLGEKKLDAESAGVARPEVAGDKSRAAKDKESDQPLARPAAAGKDANEALRAEVAASAQPESTFSLHVSDVSFRLAQAALARGELPDADRIRPEEFYNAFNYGDPLPTMAEKVGARIEQAAHPFLQQRNLVRIALRVPATGRGAAQPLRLTVLLDTSGSMERDDRAATVRRALQELIALLGENDRVTLIGFARQPRLLAEAVAGNQAGSLVDLAARTPAEGGTNLEAALQLGGELARRHALAGAQNRIVLLTDGAANLGSADPDQLAKAIEALGQQGIAFDACGIGLDGLDDAVLEALTRRGDGRYHVLNSPDEAGAGFAKQLAGAFRPAAENVKLQVRFNAARVGRYRLIGFEQHRLRSEDFRNDRVDAAELAAEEAAVALYQVEVLPEGSGELGEVAVRFRDAATGQMVERSWAVPYEPAAPAFGRATASLQLAGTAALLAEKLRGGAPAEAIRLRDLVPVMTALRGHYANEPRVQEFEAMFAQARRRLGD